MGSILHRTNLIGQARAEAHALARRLQQELRERRAKLTPVSRALGYAPQYLGRALGGRIDLKLADLFAVLRRIEVHPRRFFARHYPLAGLDRPAGTEAVGLLFEVQALLLRSGEPREVPAPEVFVKRAVGLLRGLLASSGKSCRAAAEELGMTDSALGEVLRGRSRLRAWHVLALVSITTCSPARFFQDLLAVSDAEPPLPGEAARKLTALLDGALRAARHPAAPPVVPAGQASAPEGRDTVVRDGQS